MKVPVFFAALGLTSILPAQTPVARENWNEVEQIAQSIERLDNSIRAFACGVGIQLRERSQPVAGREQILVDTTSGLQRTVACMHERFFEGAEPAEMSDRLQLITTLTQRVRHATARLSLFASVRGHLTKFENELEWLVRLFPPPAPETDALPDGAVASGPRR
jgi:hypothetical protein